MKVPAHDLAKAEADLECVGWFRVARGLLFGVGGFDGNASLAVLANTLDDELAESRSTKAKDDGAAELHAASSTIPL